MDRNMKKIVAQCSGTEVSVPTSVGRVMQTHHCTIIRSS